MLSICYFGFKWILQIGHIIDVVVVTISLIIDIIEISKPQHELAELASLLILARLWRILRIGHSFAEAAIFELNKEKEEYLIKEK